MVQPSRKFDAGSAYRYGFNGKEKDNSTGEGNLDFGARIYDGRIGRWLSLDPLQKKYPDLNPYNFVANSPIRFIDPDGKVIRVYYDGGKYFDYTPGIKPTINNEILNKVHEACMYNMNTGIGKEVWNQLANSKGVIEIHSITVTGGTATKDIEFKSMLGQKSAKGEDMIGSINWDFNADFEVVDQSPFIKGYLVPSTVLFHEIGHGQEADDVLTASKTDKDAIAKYYASANELLSPDDDFDNQEEKKNTRKRENVYVRQINKWEQENGGENPSYQPVRNNHNKGHVNAMHNILKRKIDVNKVFDRTIYNNERKRPEYKNENDGIKDKKDSTKQ